MKIEMGTPFLRGVARLLDLGGTLGRRGACAPNEAASQAMGAAWMTLGFGLQRVVDQEATAYLPEEPSPKTASISTHVPHRISDAGMHRRVIRRRAPLHLHRWAQRAAATLIFQRDFAGFRLLKY